MFTIRLKAFFRPTEYPCGKLNLVRYTPIHAPSLGVLHQYRVSIKICSVTSIAGLQLCQVKVHLAAFPFGSVDCTR